MKCHQFLFMLIAVISVAARLAVISQRSNDLLTDPDGYVAHAKMLIQGQGFSGPWTGRPTAYRPPGLPFLIAAVPGSRNSPETTIAMLHVAAGVMTVLLTRQLAELSGLSTAWAILAAGLTAVDPLLLRYTVLPMTEVLSACLLTGALLSFLSMKDAAARLIRDGGLRSAKTSCIWRWRLLAVTCGVLFGLGILLRPVFLVVAGLLGLGLTISVWRSLREQQVSGECPGRRRPDVLTWARLTSLPLIALILTISPWVIRNYVQFAHFIPATTHGGYTLALGNNPDYYRDVVNGSPFMAWDGRALQIWQERLIQEQERAGIDPNDEVAADAWMYDLALQTIRRQPGDFFRACRLRVQRFWSLRTATGESVSRLARLATSAWYALLWLGVAAAAAHRLTPAEFRTVDLWLAVAAFMLMHTFYWTDTRMRAPVMPVLCILAAVGGVVSVQLIRRFRHHFFPKNAVS